MFEPRLTPAERFVRELRWAVTPERCTVLMLRERVRRALGWFVLGALCAVLGGLAYAHNIPAEVVAADARLEQSSERFLVYSIGTLRRGVEVRCLLTIYRDRQAFTVSC